MAGATGYTLYQTTDNLSGFENADPANLAAANPAAGSSTFAGTVTSTVETLSGADTVYYLITSTQGGVESLTSAQTAATAHNFAFGTVTSTTEIIWMDRNLGASQVATASDDTLAFGDLYQWGRAADGHQVQTPTTTATLASSITPNHAQFITTTNDWTAAGVDNDGAQRTAFWSRIDGSSICPTGFRVPTADELNAERLSWISNNVAGAFASSLKLPAAGFHFNSGANANRNNTGFYWSSDTDAITAALLGFNGVTDIAQNSISIGASVRCIQN